MTMSTKRVMFTLPSSLLEQVDEEVEKLETNRSSLIREALEGFMADRRRRELREALKEGYLYRAQESLELAEEFYAAEQEAWERYAPWEES